jgi:hypothetical protein
VYFGGGRANLISVALILILALAFIVKLSFPYENVDNAKGLPVFLCWYFSEIFMAFKIGLIRPVTFKKLEMLVYVFSFIWH